MAGDRARLANAYGRSSDQAAIKVKPNPAAQSDSRNAQEKDSPAICRTLSPANATAVGFFLVMAMRIAFVVSINAT